MLNHLYAAWPALHKDIFNWTQNPKEAAIDMGLIFQIKRPSLPPRVTF